jgi:ParB family chromosome partitioning protein
MAKKAKAQEQDTVLYLDPADILANDNIRYDVRQGDVDRMVASIVDRGGIQEPVSVEVRTDAKAGEPRYSLIKGFIRHAAAVQMNKSGAGVTVPALVRHTADATDRLKTQVAENVARASLSPIDTALSIQRLMEAGVSRVDIRNLFARSGSGKASSAGVSPMSNAWLNIHLGMLELPAAIIAKIHNGEVSAAAAYELSRVPAERREAVLNAALSEVEKQAKKEETDEEKYLKGEQAEAKEAEKAKALADSITAAKQEVTAAGQMVEEKKLAYRTVQGEEHDPTDAKAKAAYNEKLSAAETDYKAAQKLDTKAKNKLSKLLGQQTKAEELKQQLADARAKGTPAPAVGPSAVRKAAQKDKETPAGAKAAAAQPPSGAVALTAAQIKDGIRDMAKTDNPIVSKVLGIFSDFCKGVLTPKLALADLEKALKVRPVAPVKK